MNNSVFDLQLFADDTASTPAPAADATPAPAAPAEPAQQPAGPAATAAPAADGNKNPFGFAADQVAQEPQEQVAPEKYEFNLPEGLKLTDELEKQFTDIAKGANLTQEQANSLIKMHSDIVTGIQRQAEEVKNNWAAECKKQGLSTPQNLAAAKLTVDTFGGGAAMQALVDSGAAFNPAVQKMLQNIGHLLQEDTAPDGATAGREPDAADVLFSNSKY